VSLGILGNKVGMTQVFDTKGNVIPVTVLKTGPCYVTQIKSNITCGYNAIQLGYVEISNKPKKLQKPTLEKDLTKPEIDLENSNKLDSVSEIGQNFDIKLLDIKRKITKPRLGHFNKVNLPPYRYLKEYKTDNLSYKLGHKFDVEIFEVGQKITVTGLTIGRGNTGNIKLHHFNGGAKSHGSKHKRMQGSIGAGTTPGRVIPGKRMPRRFGMAQRTIKGLEIIGIDKKENLLIIKGSIPGKAGNLVSLTH
jgi:large subunit ribosomal protein L3